MKKRSIGIIITYLYFFLNIVLTIFIGAFIVRKVGQTNHGVYQAMTSFVAYLILLEFGTGTIMTRNVSLLRSETVIDKELLKKHISTIWFLCISLSILIVVALMGFYFLIPPIYSNSLNIEQIELGKKIFIFAGISLFFTFLSETLNGLILGYKYYSFGKITLIIKLVLRTGLVVAALLINNNVLWVAIIDAALSILIFIVMFLFSLFKTDFRPSFKGFDWKILRAIIPFALALLLQTLANTANGNVDKFFIGVFLTPENVSIYSITTAMFTMFSAIASLPVAIYMPKNADDLKKYAQTDKLTDTLIEPCRLNALISGLVMFGFILVGHQFIIMIYGPAYEEAWLYAVICIIPTYVFSTTSIIENVVDLLKKRYIRSLILLGATILNIALTIVGIKLFGMIGAAIATAIAAIVSIIVLSIWYSRKIKIEVLHLYLESYKGILIFLLIAFTVAFPIRNWISNIYIQFFVQGTVFVILFLVLFLFFGTNQEEKDGIKSIIKKFKK